MTRINPVKLGKHRDLFADESDAVVEDWRSASPADLKRAAKAGEVTEEDLVEMREYEEVADADGDIERLVADGMSRTLARAVANGLKEDLEDLDEKGREARIKPFVDYIRGGALGMVEYETEPGNDGYSRIVDEFQSSLDVDARGRKEIKTSTLEAALRESPELRDLLDKIDQVVDFDENDLEAALRDPANWEVVRRNEYGTGRDAVWTWQLGALEDQRDGTNYDNYLDAYLNGGEVDEPVLDEQGERIHDAGNTRRRVVRYPGLSEKDLDTALNDLENLDPYISFGRRRKEMSHDYFARSYSYSINATEGEYMCAVPREDEMKAALADLLGEVLADETPDDVVYRYSGTHDSVAGPSGRGMYVARLSPRELRKEGATQGICIGTESLGHPKALREGRTQVFSIRTESGKPKFTIEMRKSSYDQHVGTIQDSQGMWWNVDEVKGKANRLPGFEAGKTTFTKPDDLRLVTDFLLHLGYTPAYLSVVTDIAPGITAMKELGVDPFAPAPRKERKPKANPNVTAARVSARVRALLERTRPMGRVRPTENPSSTAALAPLADRGSPEDFASRYQHSREEMLEGASEDEIRYGRKVIWIGLPGQMLEVDPRYVVAMEGNIFDEDKLATVAEAVRHGIDGEKPVLGVGYGTVQILNAQDIEEVNNSTDNGDVEYPMERRLDERDIGQLLYTIRDGNHRTFGALIGGETKVWMNLYDNDFQAVKEWRGLKVDEHGKCFYNRWAQNGRKATVKEKVEHFTKVERWGAYQLKLVRLLDKKLKSD